MNHLFTHDSRTVLLETRAAAARFFQAPFPQIHHSAECACWKVTEPVDIFAGNPDPTLQDLRSLFLKHNLPAWALDALDCARDLGYQDGRTSKREELHSPGGMKIAGFDVRELSEHSIEVYGGKHGHVTRITQGES